MSVIDNYSDKHDELNRRPAPASEARCTPVASAPRYCDCVLTSRDYTLLEGWLIRAIESELDVDPVLIALVRAKLAASRIVLSGDVEPDRVRGGSRVVYTLDAEAPTSQLLAHWRSGPAAGSILPITSILGISLLGMRARQRVPLVKSDGSIGGVWLEAVSSDQGRSRRAEEASASRLDAGSLVGSEPRQEQASSHTGTEDKILLFRPARPGRRSLGAPRPAGPDDPDPGPTAA
jgi:regulator of nucleoside diphosphate kinase